MGKLKENWQLALFITILSVVMSTLGAYWVQSAGVKSQKVANAASVDLLDRKQAEMKGYVDTQDGALNSKICDVEEGLKMKADKDDFEKLYIEQRETKQLVIDILKEVRK